MQRRDFVALSTAALAAPRALFAQVKRVYRIGTLDEASEKMSAPDWAVFRARLRELGLVEGANATYLARFSGGQNELLPGLAAQLVAAGADIIVCPGTVSTKAALRATANIPIVFIGPGDPVGTGLVASLARPGGNATGYSGTTPGIVQKLMEMLCEMIPGLKQIAYLTDSSNPASSVTYSRMEESARKLKLSSRMLDGVGQVALERSFDTIRREHVQGLVVSGTGALLDHRDQIVQLAAREKLPLVATRREYVDAGGLMSHGTDRTKLRVRAAELVHRILVQGAKPAEIPVEQVATVHTVLNLKTARVLGIKIPESIRLRAHEVIE